MILLKVTIGIIKICSNWPRLLLNKFISKVGLGTLISVKEIVLRNGVRFSTGSKQTLAQSDLYIVWEVWGQDTYSVSGNQAFDIKPTDVVFDIGANKGYFTVFASKQAKKVYAFEPMPDNFALLKENLNLNNVTNVQPEPVGVALSSSSRVLHLASNEGGHSIYGQGTNTVEIKTINLPQFVLDQGIQQIDYLKVDCEGAEYEIFDSFTKEFWMKVKKVSMEYHQVAGRNPQQLIDTLKNNNFEVLEFNGEYIKAINKS